MELIKEFVYAADINDKVDIIAQVRGKLVTINTSIIHTVLKLPHGVTINPLEETRYPPSRLEDYRANAQTNEGYCIARCHAKYRP